MDIAVIGVIAVIGLVLYSGSGRHDAKMRLRYEQERAWVEKRYAQGDRSDEVVRKKTGYDSADKLRREIQRDRELDDHVRRINRNR